jgi:hypothetical protein
LTTIERARMLDDAARMTVEDKASAQQNIDSAAARLKSAKSCMEALQSTIDGKLDTANRGWENRQVECHWRPDRAAGVKRLIRSDSGEVVETKDMPRQQTLDAVVSSAPKPAQAPELEGVEVGLCGEDEDGRHYRVDAVAPDSVVILYADGETKRVAAEDWPTIEPDADIDQQEYADGYELEHGPGTTVTIEQSEDGQKLLRALDREGKTREELVVETELPVTMVKGGLALFVQRGLATEGKRTGGRGKPPTTYAITDEGEEAIAQ